MGPRSMTTCLASLALAILAPALAAARPAPATGFPITPVALRELYLLSDLIVVAHVAEIRPATTEEARGWNESVAVLEVVETLIGPSEHQRVEVPFSPLMICPSPPDYDEGSRVVSFLAKDDDGFWSTVGLSYGTKDLTAEELADYRASLTQLEALSAITDWKEHRTAIQEWVVGVVERDGTRREGLLDLEQDGGRKRNQRGPGFPAASIGELSPKQESRLVDVLIGIEGKDDRGAVGRLARLIWACDDDRVTPALRRQLEARAAGQPHACNDLMWALAKRLDDQDLMAIHDRNGSRPERAHVQEFLGALSLRGIEGR
jgi:hypothetical protein